MRLRYELPLGLVFGMTSCGVLGPSEAVIEVQMDSGAYLRPSPSRTATIGFRVVNVGSVPAHFLGCPSPIPVQFEREISGTWHDDVSANIMCQAIYTWRRLELAPKRSYAYSVRWDFPGRYRFRVYYGRSAGEPFAQHARGAPFQLR